MSEEQEKIVIIMTRGPCDPDHVTLPLVMANAAMAMDVDVTLILQSHSVLFVHQGYARHVSAPGLAPLQELIDSFTGQGGKFYVCTPCCDSRNIGKEDLIAEAEMVTAGFVIDEVTSATSVLNY